MHDAKTTSLGGAGETLATGAFFLPPPFNVAALIAGTAMKVAAWYFTKDRTPHKEPDFHAFTK